MLTPRWTIVGVSAAVRDYLIQAGCGLQLHNTRAINNAVDVAALVAQALPKQAARAALDLPQTGIIFGTVGRCVKGKRHLELVQAFEQFSRTNPDAYLVIIGDGELRPSLVQYVDEHKLASKVLLIGRVDNAARFMRALDVFVFPSESEGFGLALLEAMAASVPAIVHQVEPLNSIVSGCGLSVDCTQPDRLLEALQHCYELAPYARQQMGVAHYARAQAQYDIALYHRAYRDLVEQLLSAQPEA